MPFFDALAAIPKAIWNYLWRNQGFLRIVIVVVVVVSALGGSLVYLSLNHTIQSREGTIQQLNTELNGKRDEAEKCRVARNDCESERHKCFIEMQAKSVEAAQAQSELKLANQKHQDAVDSTVRHLETVVYEVETTVDRLRRDIEKLNLESEEDKGKRQELYEDLDAVLQVVAELPELRARRIPRHD